MRIEHHPIGVWVREDGCVYLPQSGKNPPHWTFGGDNGRGYLRVRINGKRYLVHRLVAEAYFGEIPNGMEIDHSDRNRRNNALTNLRIVSRTDNNRNTSKNDRVDARGGTHWYEDKKQFYREYYTKNHEKALARQKELDASRRNTHKCVRFSDGKKRYIPNEQATELLKLPVKERIYDKV